MILIRATIPIESTFAAVWLRTAVFIVLTSTFSWSGQCDVTDGLILYFPFEGDGPVVQDATGHGLDGVLVAGRRARGRFGGGLRFVDGNAQVISPFSRRLMMTADFSVAIWIRPDSLNPDGENRLIFTDQFNLDLLNGFGRLDLHSHAAWHGTPLPVVGPSSAPTLSTGQWHHLAGTFSAAESRGAFYVDGDFQAAVELPGNLDPITSVLRLGRSGAGMPAMNGLIDEVRIYARALSGEEVPQLFQHVPTAVELSETRHEGEARMSRPELPSVNPELMPTSELMPTCPDYFTDVAIQTNNHRLRSKVRPRSPADLEDNRIGIDVGNWVGGPEVYDRLLRNVGDLGVKWLRTNFWSPNPLNWQEVLRPSGDYVIDPECDRFITDLADRGVNVVMTLSAGAGLRGREAEWWGGTGSGALGDDEPVAWFTSQDGRGSFAAYARMMAEHFRNRVRYYEIWNEPGIHADPRGDVALSDYGAVVDQAARAIHEVDPHAKIVAGAVGRFNEGERNLLAGILASQALRHVDALSWHPFYGESPYTDRERGNRYWTDYVATVRAFQARADALGYTGSFMVEEMVWRTHRDLVPQEQPLYGDIEAAKYGARAIITHLALGFEMVSSQILMPGVIQLLPKYYVLRTLCTLMAGASPADFAVTLEPAIPNVVVYTFRLSDGRHIAVLWRDVIAREYDPGVLVTVSLPYVQAAGGVGTDTLNGVEQSLAVDSGPEGTTIRDVVVRDYPLALTLDVAR